MQKFWSEIHAYDTNHGSKAILYITKPIYFLIAKSWTNNQIIEEREKTTCRTNPSKEEEMDPKVEDFLENLMEIKY